MDQRQTGLSTYGISGPQPPHAPLPRQGTVMEAATSCSRGGAGLSDVQERIPAVRTLRAPAGQVIQSPLSC